MKQPVQQKKKVAQVLYSGLGGHGSVFTSLIEGDESGWHQHQALFYGIEPLKPEYRQFCEQNKIDFVAIQKPARTEITSVWQVYQALKKLRPQVLVLHSMNLLPVAWLFCLLHNCQLIPVEHTPNAAKRKSEWLWTWLSFFLAKKVVYLSDEYVRQLNQKTAYLFPGRFAAVIPNGINTQKFSCAARACFSGEVVFAMQSRFSPTKDHQTLLRGFALFLHSQPERQKYKLKLAGSGQTLAQTQQLARELGIADSVEFCGMLPEADLVGFLCRAHVYLHCSLAETACTAVMQAMACGLPVIASNIPGINQLFGNPISGELVAPGNPEALAAKLTWLTGPGFEARCRQMGRAAQNHAAQAHSHKTMFRKYASIWQQQENN